MFERLPIATGRVLVRFRDSSIAVLHRRHLKQMLTRQEGSHSSQQGMPARGLLGLTLFTDTGTKNWAWCVARPRATAPRRLLLAESDALILGGVAASRRPDSRLLFIGTVCRATSLRMAVSFLSHVPIPSQIHLPRSVINSLILFLFKDTETLASQWNTILPKRSAAKF